MQSRLTHSRKRRRPRSQASRSGTPKPSAVRRKGRPHWLDAMDEHCYRLDMMAELLQACGEPLEPGVMQRLGCWFGREVEQLKALLADVWKEAR